MNLFQAIIFDMDGVLIDSEPLFLDAINTLVVQAGKEPITNDENKEQLLGTTVEETWRRVIKMRDLPLPVEEYVAQYDPIVRQVLEDHLVPQPGVRELIRTLKERRLHAAVASSSLRSWVELKLDTIGLRDAFDTYLGGDDVSSGKPAPDIYLKAATAIGIRPNECIAIEDSPFGIEAAKGAGMYTIAVLTESTRGLDLSKADVILETLEDFQINLLANHKIMTTSQQN
jgi:HAD superfamily hydrolase (TIGR01509 family)